MRIQISKCHQLHDPTWAAPVQERLEHVDEKKTEGLSSSACLSRCEPSFLSQVACRGVLVTPVRSNEPVLTVNSCDYSLCRNGRQKEAPGFLSALALGLVQAVINDLCQRQKIVIVIQIWQLHSKLPQWPAKCALELLSQTLFTLCRGVSPPHMSGFVSSLTESTWVSAILSDLIYANKGYFGSPVCRNAWKHAILRVAKNDIWWMQETECALHYKQPLGFYKTLFSAPYIGLRGQRFFLSLGLKLEHYLAQILSMVHVGPSGRLR